MVRLSISLSLLALQHQQASTFAFVPNSIKPTRNARSTEYRRQSARPVLHMQADSDRPIVKSILDRVKTPADMKGMDMRELKQVSFLISLKVLFGLYLSYIDIEFSLHTSSDGKY